MSIIIRRALISVSDKTGVVEFGKFLIENNVEILSTGGSAKVLRNSGVKVKEVSAYTGFPEILDGRVKTLQPLIHGGLLSIRDNLNHEKDMKKHNIETIDLLCVNLYPFEDTVANGENFKNCIENIDIGGPALIRAAAKNYQFVTVIIQPSDYKQVMLEMKSNGRSTSEELRKQLAEKAFSRTSLYDAAISSWFAKRQSNSLPEYITLGAKRKQSLRYGENPHQKAAFYTNSENRPGVANARQIQGKELSFNNFNDTDAAFELVAEFEDTACAIIKHANPCGVACGNTLKDAYNKALACDTESAFGGIVAFNRELDAETAELINKLFAEVIIAPEIENNALQVLAQKENLRVLVTGSLPNAKEEGITVRSLSGGYLLQTRDNLTLKEMKVVTKRQPSKQEIIDLKFAFIVGKHVKSNSIVYAKNSATVGIGAGQMSRVNSSRIASWKAADAAKNAGETKSLAYGSVVASDAFFPFADGLLAAAEAGASAIIQPGGSVRDDEIISAADEAGLSMIMTGIRHFKH